MCVSMPSGQDSGCTLSVPYSPLLATSICSLCRWQRRLIAPYPPPAPRACLLAPCSHSFPFSLRFAHDSSNTILCTRFFEHASRTILRTRFFAHVLHTFRTRSARSAGCAHSSLSSLLKVYTKIREIVGDDLSSSSRSSPVHGEPASPRPPGTPTSPAGAGGFHARGSPFPHYQQRGDGRGGGGGGRGNGTVSPGGWVQDRALPGFVRKTRRRRLVEDAPKLGVKIHTHPVRTNCMAG